MNDSTVKVFALDDRLAADSHALCHSTVSLLRVSADARFPWLILVPMRADLFDLVDLEPAEETIVMADIRAASLALRQATGCDKLNVASLGNQVRQLHIHIIARFIDDAAWPGPVWGTGTALPMDSLPPWALAVRAALAENGWTS